jgi:2-succinyl-6-hydroxy-2,4-cyclohexadiene-1-carboxylate synthase
MPPPVIAVPGALSGPAPLAAALERIFPGRVIRVVDPLADVGGSAATFASWVEAFLANVDNKEPALLFGYSMGARLAMYALRADPARWASVTLVSCHPGLKDPEEKSARIREDESWARRAESGPWREFLDDWDARPVFQSGIPPRDWCSRLARVWEQDRRDLEARRLAVAASLRAWSLGHQDDFRSFLSQCRVPVHWVTGELDGKFTRLGRELAAACPRLRHTIVPWTGHRVPWEAESL